MNRYNDLEHLAKLYSEGVINTEEFQREKSFLLDTLSSSSEKTEKNTLNNYNSQNIEKNFTNSYSKNQFFALILCFFLGDLGLHRFYLGYKKSAIIMLILSVFVFYSCGSMIFSIFDPGTVNESSWEYIGELNLFTKSPAQNQKILLVVITSTIVYLGVFVWRVIDFIKILIGKMRNAKENLLQH